METLLLTLASAWALCVLYGVYRVIVLGRQYIERREAFNRRVQGRRAERRSSERNNDRRIGIGQANWMGA